MLVPIQLCSDLQLKIGFLSAFPIDCCLHFSPRLSMDQRHFAARVLEHLVWPILREPRSAIDAEDTTIFGDSTGADGWTSRSCADGRSLLSGEA